jgi:hypothetical protein
MEARINGPGASGKQMPWRPEHEPKPHAPLAHDEPGDVPRPPRPAPDPSAELGAWFDRNGDGQIDTTTWVVGGDAYLRVDKHVSELLDREIVRPRDRVAIANETAVNAYRKYGTSAGQPPRSIVEHLVEVVVAEPVRHRTRDRGERVIVGRKRRVVLGGLARQHLVDRAREALLLVALALLVPLLELGQHLTTEQFE